jgi:hypothetical protein
VNIGTGLVTESWHPLCYQVRADRRGEPRKDETMTAMRDLRSEQQGHYLPFLSSSYPPAPVV